jgi:hypothetical protein
MSNFSSTPAVGTRVQDPITLQTGTVINPPNAPYTAAQQATWQPVPPSFVPNYDATLVMVQFDDPQGNGNKIPGGVFVSYLSLAAL